MTNRFFKLLYVLGLLAIVVALPIIVLNIPFDKVMITSYKAKCISNGQYVVLQGAPIGEVEIWNEIHLDSSSNRMKEAIKKQLNFYCEYYDEIQPHIAAYNQTNTFAEQASANKRFAEFKNSKEDVDTYPELYKLEPVEEEIRWNELYYPFLAWVLGSFIFFLFLQFLRICYTYVTFGELVWHPFKARRLKQSLQRDKAI